MLQPTYRSDGPLYCLLNAGSGHADQDAARALLEQKLRAAGRQHHWCTISHPAELERVAQDAITRACEQHGAVVVLGGDGTISTVAHLALPQACPIGVLPLGTFNYFCRTHAVPEALEDAVDYLLNAQPQPVQIGLLNERAFTVNASLGLYPQILEDREGYKQRYGRRRIVAVWSGLVTLLHGIGQLRIQLDSDGVLTHLRTPTLFVANNRLQLEQAGFAEKDVVESGRMVAVTLKPVGTASLLWLLLCGAFGKLGEAEQVDSFSFHRLTVRSSRTRRLRALKVALDGEVSWMKPPLTFRVSPQPLYLLKTPATAQENELS